MRLQYSSSLRALNILNLLRTACNFIPLSGFPGRTKPPVFMRYVNSAPFLIPRSFNRFRWSS